MARLPNTMVFSRKLENNGLYKGNKTFSKEVLRTADIATSKENHIKLLEKRFPNYNIIPLWTYEHGIMILQFTPSSSFDSSADAFMAYKKEQDIEKFVENINQELENEYYNDDEDREYLMNYYK